jgi:uncharacterized DUF497 family protein
MKIEYDPAKRLHTLEARGLDFESIVDVFDGFYLVRTDDRKEYGEIRNIMLGALGDPACYLCLDPKERRRSRYLDEDCR